MILQLWADNFNALFGHCPCVTPWEHLVRTLETAFVLRICCGGVYEQNGILATPRGLLPCVPFGKLLRESSKVSTESATPTMLLRKAHILRRNLLWKYAYAGHTLVMLSCGEK